MKKLFLSLFLLCSVTGLFAFNPGIYGGIGLNLDKVTTIEDEKFPGIGIGGSLSVKYFPKFEEKTLGYGLNLDVYTVGSYSDASDSDIGKLRHSMAAYTINLYYLTNITSKDFTYLIFGMGILDCKTEGYLYGRVYPTDFISVEQSKEVLAFGMGYTYKHVYFEPKILYIPSNSESVPKTSLLLTVGYSF